MRNLPARLALLVLPLAASLLQAAQPATQPTTAPAETPQQHDARMAWWREARFGMFIHWGLYAVPAGQYDGKKVPGIGEWIMHRAPISIPEYEKFVPQFNPTKFDARQWVRIAKSAGMKYIVITSKHHDGFAMFDSKVSDYDIMATPFKRDPLKELADACREEGIRLCFYHSIMDWHHPDAQSLPTWPAYRTYMEAQLKELLTNYGPIGVLWFDGEWTKETKPAPGTQPQNMWTAPQGRELAALCRSLQPQIILNNRVGRRGRDDGDFGTPEQKIVAEAGDWESCMTMNNTWGFKSDDNNWKSPQTIIRMLVECSAQGGNFLLNVGPTAQGLIPQPSVDCLDKVGQWMSKNSPSIYASRRGPLARQDWGWTTTRDNTLYLHIFKWPGKSLQIPNLTAAPVAARFLATDAPLKFTTQDTSTTLQLPEAAPDPIDTVIALEFAAPPTTQK